ncbi:phosphoribosylaminoimidazole carboxylase ade2 [Puccinia graminis f. sp. tritici]|uniref:Phosphoribosylaminoimidazole carboxylase n=1 Tax=Puccinia graminis f. sp. tritici TaxID=56615 RepID=A0A5B0ND02_PUCGR|nr:phosphoribosylaminoimidazole carboxylase ade2 [Puccinia graminis f. sp. tritici]
MADQVIGVLGGGQLGRMMVQAAVRLGIPIITVDKEHSPASQVSNPRSIDSQHPVDLNHQIGSFNSVADIEKLSQMVDILTIEIEHVNVSILKTLLKNQQLGRSKTNPIKIYPHPEVIEIIQDKFKQKLFLSQAGIPVSDFEEIQQRPSISELEEQVRLVAGRLGFPLMLKSRLLAYDGRGNFLVKTAEDIPRAIRALTPTSFDSKNDLSELKLYAEGFVPFTCEIAVMVVKGIPSPGSADPNIRVYPPVQTIHQDNICHTVHSPLRLGGPSASKSALTVAQRSITALGAGAVGVFAVEMFLLPDNTVLVNEIAPRPHNSYHHTISSTAVSQFTAHLLAITSKPLPPTESFELAVPSAAMVNVLGHESGEKGEKQVKKCFELVSGLKGVSVESYGKFGCQRGRKMGHINVIGESDADVREIVSKVVRCLPVNQTDESDFEGLIKSAPTAARSGGFSDPNPLVSIIMGSDSDLPTMIEASRILSHPLFQVAHELTIVSAHRTPERMVEFSQSAASRGVKVIIAGAGGAAHLPGMVSALTPLPVIGVPVKGKTLDGVDSLHSIVQMPRGIPVATVAIGNSTNAALLAVRILSTGIPRLVDAMSTYMAQMESEVLAKVDKLSQVGWESY